MSRIHVTRVVTVFVLAAYCALAAPVGATNLDIFMTADGDMQGQIPGDASYPGEEGSIALVGYAHELTVPVDPVTGLPTGSVQHGPVMITKHHDQATIPFLNGILTNDRFAVRIRFYDGNAAPGVLLYDVRLDDALITSRAESETTTDQLTEAIEMVYQNITWTWTGQTPLTAGDPQSIELRHVLLPPSPNPMRGDVVFRFGLPAETHATLDVFDVSGRLVRGIFDGTANINESVRWDGEDGGGRRVASGVYLVRLSWEAGTSTRRITVLE
jgi:type VI secretion system secreted protein Hcp